MENIIIYIVYVYVRTYVRVYVCVYMCTYRIISCFINVQVRKIAPSCNNLIKLIYNGQIMYTI